MHRSLATHLAVLVTGMGLGLGAVAVAQDKPGASAAAADSRIVRELRTANQRLTAAVFYLGTSNRKLDLINQNLTGLTSIPPTGKSIRDVLRQVCVNTANSTVQQSFC